MTLGAGGDGGAVIVGMGAGAMVGGVGSTRVSVRGGGVRGRVLTVGGACSTGRRGASTCGGGGVSGLTGLAGGGSLGITVTIGGWVSVAGGAVGAYFAS